MTLWNDRALPLETKGCVNFSLPLGEYCALLGKWFYRYVRLLDHRDRIGDFTAAGSRKVGYRGERSKPLTFDANFRVSGKLLEDRYGEQRVH